MRKRLRTKLQEYYETEGEFDRVLIDLPKGHYRVAFSTLLRKRIHRFAKNRRQKPLLRQSLFNLKLN